MNPTRSISAKKFVHMFTEKAVSFDRIPLVILVEMCVTASIRIPKSTVVYVERTMLAYTAGWMLAMHVPRRLRRVVFVVFILHRGHGESFDNLADGTIR